ncbi:bifunctional proline dehydrogenase/L-glutamate gamma-semialdehyde dehydrogenase PutA [Marinobacter confluentis]|uniref:Bifunctional protein PutA n=1 Tax=Marinobacter confluentis TaxID=1697557 RepID=A0A4Z1C6V4_9GAMM|nr:bifunctional proline dehydrogenase/L-glutamate gamma-semialdehyde dehydrogenase PutA [Marinobacter confluentis]TGN41330.1 bifunctional proline dehydrogenase/L-glutamate gamma-semialdehyde dehydrogenase PutA [Marinobacter confluentis]
MFDASRALEPAFQEQPISFFWQSILANYAVNEDSYLRKLITLAQSDAAEQKFATETATDLIHKVRERDDGVHMIDALLQEYSLDTEEGILLMCLTEALMRIPDKFTADRLIHEKMTDADWDRHLGCSDSTLVNASTWGLLLTGRVIRMDRRLDGSPSGIWRRLVRRSGEPMIRRALNQAMTIMGRQFVLGESIFEALDHAESYRSKGYTYSFDMLGEAAMTEQDAARHLSDYRHAIAAVGQQAWDSTRLLPPSISIKLSALHPRYDAFHENRVLEELHPVVCELVGFAREEGVAITLDAEEMDRLELSLKLFEQVFRSPSAEDWSGLGLAVQAYSKRALPVICWLNKLAKEQGKEIPVRLVKGAYWDNEIKHAQQLGIANYPVFTRKESTDTSYLACLRFLLSDYTRGALYPQMASHNAHTVASVLAIARKKERPIELQRLHGMGDALYESVLKEHETPVRIYAPVGGYRELLPYLIRRLLENGANSSFVHRLVDAATPVDALVQDPVQELEKYPTLSNDRIPSPSALYGNERLNARGWNLRVADHRDPLLRELESWRRHRWSAGPLIMGEPSFKGEGRAAPSAADMSHKLGKVFSSDLSQTGKALQAAQKGLADWPGRPVAERVQCLLRYAELLEENTAELVSLCSQETGKSVRDAVDELREAVDLCRYYASQGKARFGHAMALPGPTGETNELYMEGRGIFLCISPQSSPLAVFSGQILAALMAGNPVLAKPAYHASLTGFRAAELMLEAGVPAGALQLLPGDGATIAKRLLPDPGIAGVAYTGSRAVARLINRALAEREGAMAPLIAEMGGQNAMIVDSSALPEQVVADVIKSAFTGAGQRSAALRLLYLQRDVAERIETLLAGAMSQLSLGDPGRLNTDIGPIADAGTRSGLVEHLEVLESGARLIGRAPLPEDADKSLFVAPTAWEIKSLKYLKNDCFGPILHVIRYDADRLDNVIEDINGLGWALTLGIHSRSESSAAYIEKRIKAGNTYVNRDQLGAVAGVQPFGGQGLTGTGPKSGGPNYLLRFAAERTRTINTTALGGNASLLSLGIERV